jgi:hypothetical protein
MAVLVVGLLAIGLAGSALAGPAQEKSQEEEKAKEKAKTKKYTNEDLKKRPGSSGGGDDTAAVGEAGGEEGVPQEFEETGELENAAAEQQADPWDSVGVATDSQGRGEEYWREAMTKARAAVANARKEHDRLQGEMNRNRVDFTAIDDPAARALVHERIEELFSELSLAEQALADAEQSLRDLEEDARRSGVLPGWLR